MLVMPTRSLLPGTRCFGLSLCCDYFAQIVMLRLRKISPNCAQIVLEKKKITHFLLARSKFLLENHYVFEKKKKKNNKKKKKKEFLKKKKKNRLP
jgi:hypothetical protein